MGKEIALQPGSFTLTPIASHSCHTGKRQVYKDRQRVARRETETETEREREGVKGGCKQEERPGPQNARIFTHKLGQFFTPPTSAAMRRHIGTPPLPLFHCSTRRNWLKSSSSSKLRSLVLIMSCFEKIYLFTGRGGQHG